VPAAGDERDGINPPVIMPKDQTHGRNAALGGVILVPVLIGAECAMFDTPGTNI
jgi:hypothetical protein